MRITIDLDTRSKLKLNWTLLKGRLLCGKKADEIYQTRKGFHVIWHGLKIDKETSFRWRGLLGDDRNRIRLDRNPKRITQVLFAEKHITYKDKDGNITKEENFTRRRIK